MTKYEQPNCDVCKSKDGTLLHFCSCLELENINASKTCNTYKRGHIIFQEGGLPFNFFCINKGSVKIVKQASAGKEMIVRMAFEGDMIGYRSLIAHQRYHSTAIAAEDSNICIIPKSEFYKLFEQNGKFHDALINLVCEVTNDTENKMTNIAYKPVRGRLAEALLLLNGLVQYKEGINLTREDLASLVGTVKETAIRTLSEFKSERLIEIDKRSIKIKDKEGLIKVSNLYD